MTNAYLNALTLLTQTSDHRVVFLSVYGARRVHLQTSMCYINDTAADHEVDQLIIVCVRVCVWACAWLRLYRVTCDLCVTQWLACIMEGVQTFVNCLRASDTFIVQVCLRRTQ